MVETLTGTIERVTFHNPENGFAVLRVQVDGRRDPATVVGVVTSASAGELVEATGQWCVDAEHGPQFRAREMRTSHPASLEGIERYLGSGAIRSVGPHLAARIVAVYKAQTLEIVDRCPDMLLHIRGIGRKRLERIRTSWQEQKEVRKIMLFLEEYGLGSGARAMQIYRTYGQRSIAAIKENPYQLAETVRGIGFKTADELAQRLGMPADAPERARAAVRFVLAELTEEGHCGYAESQVVDRTVELVRVERRIIEDAVAFELEQGNVVRDRHEEQDWLALRALYQCEWGIASVLKRLLSDSAHPLPQIKVDVALQWVQHRLGLELAAAQQEAIRMVCRHKLVVITGGPGVGKTTLVRSILEIFAAKKLTCVLAAPTGRAAKRLAEATACSAKTVHRLLEFDPSSGDFRRNQKQPLQGDLFVLDEASMVDVVLGYKFLRAVPARGCVVLVGDVDQLPSVGPGAFLSDLISSQTVPVVRLTEIFRQAAQSRIVVAARDINAGCLPTLETPESLQDFYFVEANEPEAVEKLILKLVRERIPDRFGLDPRKDIQVLTPMNRGQLGARNLNQVLQEALNPAGDQAEIERYGWKFRVGDRIIQTVNNYDRDVFNGDLGSIEGINRVEQELTATFDERQVSYDFSGLDELALAYVLTIHKSQGSEYPCVVIPLHTQHYLMLRRNLLYTAVTRGKRLVVLVGKRSALQMAVRREDTHRRSTMLRVRLEAALGREERQEGRE